MLPGHFTKLQKYNVPINNVHLAKRQAKQVSFSHSSERQQGVEFRVSGATENARSPSVVRRVYGSCNVRLSAERRRQRAATLVDRRRVSAKYTVALSVEDW